VLRIAKIHEKIQPVEKSLPFCLQKRQKSSIIENNTIQSFRLQPGGRWLLAKSSRGQGKSGRRRLPGDRKLMETHPLLEMVARLREAVDTPFAARTAENGSPLHGSIDALEKACEETLAAQEAQIASLRAALVKAEKQAETSRAIAREMRTTANEVQAIFDHMADGVMAFDMQGVVQRANAGAVALLGFDPLHMHRRTVLSRIRLAGEDGVLLEPGESPVDRAERGEVILNWRMTMENRRGRALSLLVSALPLINGVEYNGAVLMMKDVTRYEGLLAENERQRGLFERVIREAPLGIALIDCPSLRYSVTNPYYVEHAQQGDLIGRLVEDVWGKQAVLLVRQIRHVAETGEPFNTVDAMFQWHDGSEEPHKGQLGQRFFSYSLTPLNGPGGKVERILILVTDTTESVLSSREREAEAEERARIQQSLRLSEALRSESEDRLALALEAADIGVWQHDLETDEMVWDDRTRALFDFAPGEPVTPTVFWSAVHPDDRERLRAEISYMQQNQEAFELEYRIITPSGQVRWIYERCRSLYNERGTVTALYGMAMDVTQRNEAQAERARLLRQVEAEHAWLEAVLQELPVGVWIAGTDGRLLRHNPRAEEIWGGVHQPLAQGIAGYGRYQGWWSETGEPVLPESWPLSRALLYGERITGVEVDIRRLDDTTATNLVSAAPVRDTQGRLLGAVAVEQDITEQKNAEKQIRNSEARFRVALANAPLSVFQMDHDLRYTWAYNPIAIVSGTEILGKRDEDLFEPEDAVRLTAFKRGALASAQPMRAEFRIRQKGEDLHLILTAEALRDRAGQVTGLTGASFDITEQRRMEARHIEYATSMEVQRRLLENREMERQSIARELHDGPIQELVGLLFGITAALDGLDDPAARDALLRLRDSLQAMVGDLRMVCNELRPPTLVGLGLERAIRNHAGELRSRYPGLKMILDLMEDSRALPDNLRLALYRIYQEGITNIVRHAQATRVIVRLSLTPERVVLELEDNGMGFAAEPDWRELARSGHLGLAGMKERAEAAGGALTITSQPGRGSLVRVEVPLPVAPVG
jgi:PAS domain S-box-containing protein